METLKIELKQENSNGIETFSAVAESIKVRSEDNLAGEIVDFVKSTIDFHTKLTKLGVKGLNKVAIKKSQPLFCTITNKVDDTAVSFKIANFGSLATELSKDELREVINTVIDHNSRFAHLWA